MKERIKDFFIKLLALKTVVFLTATALFIWGEEFPWYAWLISAAMFLGLRYMEKLQGLGGFRK